MSAGATAVYGAGIQLISVMTHQPPLDQRIVDEYFRLVLNRKTKDIAWLYGMIATYGLKPEELSIFDWGPEDSVLVPQKKRPVRPLHPQWVLLFGLKEKQPCALQSCWPSLCSRLYEAMAYQDFQLNITDLILAHRLRKDCYRSIKKPSASSLAFAGAS